MRKYLRYIAKMCLYMCDIIEISDRKDGCQMKLSAQSVQDKLIDLGFSNEVVELPDSTRTAKEAAEAIGCQVEQIAKSIVFKRVSGAPLLVIASGVNRIDELQIEKAIGEAVHMADAEFVKDKTGFVIGGVAPVGHAQSLDILIDEDLIKYDDIWAAAGHPKAVFHLTPDELIHLTEGTVMAIKR